MRPNADYDAFSGATILMRGRSMAIVVKTLGIVITKHDEGIAVDVFAKTALDGDDDDPCLASLSALFADASETNGGSDDAD